MERYRLTWDRSVGRPLDCLEVNALLVHFIQRAHVAQVVNRTHHVLDNVVDLFVGVESADAEADTAVSQLVADAQRLEHNTGDPAVTDG